MATSEIGTLKIIPVTTSQTGKVNSFNGHIEGLEKSSAGLLLVDCAGLSGTEVLTETFSKNGVIDTSGALAGDLIVEIDAEIQQMFWFRDRTTGGVITIQPTGGIGVVIPKDRWVLYYMVDGSLTTAMAGWQDSSMAPAISYVSNYQEDASRPLKIRKNGGAHSTPAGLVHLEGAVERLVSIPAQGDTICTLPAAYRPAHRIGAIVIAAPETAGASGATSIAVEIETNGNIVIRNLMGWTPLIATPIDLSGITFFAGN